MLDRRFHVFSAARRLRRRAFTVTEVLVSIGILGLLMAIIVPAVQRSRASARRIECSNNLKQVGVASHSAAERTGAFPAGSYAWNALTVEMGLPPNPPDWVLSLTQQYSRPVMLCPSDPLAKLERLRRRSYAFNYGTRWRGSLNANGYATGKVEGRKPGSITDGLSQTVALSEMLFTPPHSDPPPVQSHPRRYMWWTARYVDPLPGNEAEFIEVCRHERTSQLPPDIWSPDGADQGYDHFLPPNSPGCWNGPAEGRHGGNAIAPASSMHDGGVNVLWADGHVTFVSDSIDADVWRALGTVNGHESIGGWE